LKSVGELLSFWVKYVRTQPLVFKHLEKLNQPLGLKNSKVNKPTVVSTDVWVKLNMD